MEENLEEEFRRESDAALNRHLCATVNRLKKVVVAEMKGQKSPRMFAVNASYKNIVCSDDTETADRRKLYFNKL